MRLKQLAKGSLARRQLHKLRPSQLHRKVLQRRPVLTSVGTVQYSHVHGMHFEKMRGHMHSACKAAVFLQVKCSDPDGGIVQALCSPAALLTCLYTMFACAARSAGVIRQVRLEWGP